MELSNEIIEKYVSGLSTIKLGDEYGVSRDSIRKFLIKNGIKLRSNKINSRKYKANEHVFDVIDTEEKAYWLGFLFADGYVSSVTGKRVGLAISSADRTHLEKYKAFLESNYRIATYKASGYGSGEYCRIIVCSDTMYDALVAHGVVEHKSKVLVFPTHIDDKLKRHFLRGYLDGDGCITRNGNSFAVKIMGTDMFLDSIIEYLTDKCVYKYGRKEKRKEQCEVKSLNLFGETAYKTIKLLYCESNISLDRKFDLAQKAICYFSRLYQQ